MLPGETFDGRLCRSESLIVDSHPLQKRQMHSGQVLGLFEFQLTARIDCSAAAARNDGWQMVFAVFIAVAKAAAVHNHAVFEQRTAVWLFDRLQPTQEIGKLL